MLMSDPEETIRNISTRVALITSLADFGQSQAETSPTDSPPSLWISPVQDHTAWIPWRDWQQWHVLWIADPFYCTLRQCRSAPPVGLAIQICQQIWRIPVLATDEFSAPTNKWRERDSRTAVKSVKNVQKSCIEIIRNPNTIKKPMVHHHLEPTVICLLRHGSNHWCPRLLFAFEVGQPKRCIVRCVEKFGLETVSQLQIHDVKQVKSEEWNVHPAAIYIICMHIYSINTLCICMYIYMYVYVCVCIYIYIPESSNGRKFLTIQEVSFHWASFPWCPWNEQFCSHVALSHSKWHFFFTLNTFETILVLTGLWGAHLAGMVPPPPCFALHVVLSALSPGKFSFQLPKCIFVAQLVDAKKWSRKVCFKNVARNCAEGSWCSTFD